VRRRWWRSGIVEKWLRLVLLLLMMMRFAASAVTAALVVTKGALVGAKVK